MMYGKCYVYCLHLVEESTGYVKFMRELEELSLPKNHKRDIEGSIIIHVMRF